MIFDSEEISFWILVLWEFCDYFKDCGFPCDAFLISYSVSRYLGIYNKSAGHGGSVVTHSPPTSEVGGSNPGPYMGKLVVAYRWLAVYSTEP